MALKDTPQPEIIEISDSIRLRRYDGNFGLFLPGYQNPVVYKNSEGIFDESKIPDLNYVEGMCRYLSGVGELYYIEAEENGCYRPIGDVTIKDENPPIAIWLDDYRGKGIGTLVMQAVIDRLKSLGYLKIQNAIPANRDEIGSPKPDKPRLEWIKNLGGYLENAAAPARQGFHNKIVQWAHIILLLLIANLL
nr:GNAT family N-acetyltransferase [uncultured Acetatifactor sp.]